MKTLLFALILTATTPNIDTLHIGDNTLTLQAEAWRNMMPGPDVIDRGTVITVWLTETTNKRIPPTLEITRVWAIQVRDTWKSNYSGERRINSLTVRKAPSYDIGSYISVVAEVWDTRTNQLHYIAAVCVQVKEVH